MEGYKKMGSQDPAIFPQMTSGTEISQKRSLSKCDEWMTAPLKKCSVGFGYEIFGGEV